MRSTAQRSECQTGTSSLLSLLRPGVCSQGAEMYVITCTQVPRGRHTADQWAVLPVGKCGLHQPAAAAAFWLPSGCHTQPPAHTLASTPTYTRTCWVTPEQQEAAMLWSSCMPLMLLQLGTHWPAHRPHKWDEVNGCSHSRQSLQQLPGALLPFQWCPCRQDNSPPREARSMLKPKGMTTVTLLRPKLTTAVLGKGFCS